MSVFDQRGQKVTYQYNVNGSINFAQVANSTHLATELAKLADEVSRAGSAGVIPEENTIDAVASIRKAESAIRKPEAQVPTVIGFLKSAATTLATFSAAAGLVKGIGEAIETVQRMLH